MKQTPFKSASGFTLIEILVVIGIIAVLSTLAYPAFKIALRRADQSSGLNKLRNISQAMMLYTNDHDGFLPGPLWPGQVMESDPARTGRLVRELGSYLGYPDRNEITLVRDFAPRLLLYRTPPAALSVVRPYVMNLDFTNAEGEIVRPMGNLAADTNATSIKYVNLPAEIRSKWMMSDADQTHPQVIGTTWRPFTPAIPIYANSRNALFYDMHAEILPLNAF